MTASRNAVHGGAGLISPTGHASGPAYRLDGFLAADHYVDVPLDHLEPGRATTAVFARAALTTG